MVGRWLLLLGGLFLLFWPCQCKLMAIDYGAQWTKAALVTPRNLLEIVLTKDTKRKDQSAISFWKGERYFGGEAADLGSRYPASTFASVKSLLGRGGDGAWMAYADRYPATVINRTSAGSVQFHVPDDEDEGVEVYTVEELVAMQLGSWKGLVEATAGEPIRQAVLTVPPFATQLERQAYIDATEIAGLDVLGLVNDGLAVAIQYAMARTFSEIEYHVVHDVGASSTTSTLVSFITEQAENKNVTTVAVRGVGFDREAGGNVMDKCVFDILISSFIAKHGDGIRGSARSLAKLRRESTRVKQLLSANAEVYSSIESLYDGIDFRHKVSRADFDDGVAQAVATQPVWDALVMSGIGMEQVTSVIFAGGASRTPIVQRRLEEVGVPADKLVKTVNADEAAVLGAAFRGAGLSGQYKVKQLDIQDASPYDVDVVFPGSTQSLYRAGQAYGQTQTFNMTSTSDFSFQVAYGDSARIPEDVSKILMDVKVTEVSSSAAAFAKNRTCIDPQVRVRMRVNKAGMVEIVAVDLICHMQAPESEGLADKFKGMFAGKKESTIAQPVEAKDDSKGPNFETSRLKFEVRYPGIRPFTPAEKTASKRKLRSLDALDKDKHLRDREHNILESTLHRVRDHLTDSAFLQYLSKSEQKDLEDVSVKVREWANRESRKAKADQFKKQSKLLLYNCTISKASNRSRTIEEKATARKEEWLNRPAKVKALRDSLNTTRQFIKDSIIKHASTKSAEPAEVTQTSTKAKAIPVSDLFFDPVAVGELSTLCDTVENWLEAAVAAQNKLMENQDPYFRISDVEKRAKQLDSGLLKVLMAKPPKVNTSSTSITPSTTPASPTITTSITQSATTDLPVEPAPASKEELDTHDEL